MKVTLGEDACVVEREKGDPKMRGGTFGTAESQLYHRMKKVLNAQGHDLVQRRTQADGHMYGCETTHYLRDRKWRFCIVDGNWAMHEDAVHSFNTDGKAVFMVERWPGPPGRH